MELTAIYCYQWCIRFPQGWLENDSPHWKENYGDSASSSSVDWRGLHVRAGRMSDHCLLCHLKQTMKDLCDACGHLFTLYSRLVLCDWPMLGGNWEWLWGWFELFYNNISTNDKYSRYLVHPINPKFIIWSNHSWWCLSPWVLPVQRQLPVVTHSHHHAIYQLPRRFHGKRWILLILSGDELP